MNASIVNSFFLNPINDEEVESLIKEMYTSKSVGPYSIPINTLKLSCSSPVKTSSQANWTCSKNIGNDGNIAKIEQKLNFEDNFSYEGYQFSKILVTNDNHVTIHLMMKKFKLVKILIKN